MTPTTHPARSLLFALVLLAQAHAAQAASSTALRPDGAFPLKGGNIEYRKSLATPSTADGTTPQIKKTATHFSSGASHLRRQIQAQRKADTGK